MKDKKRKTCAEASSGPLSHLPPELRENCANTTSALAPHLFTIRPLGASCAQLQHNFLSQAQCSKNLWLHRTENVSMLVLRCPPRQTKQKKETIRELVSEVGGFFEFGMFSLEKKHKSVIFTQVSSLVRLRCDNCSCVSEEGLCWAGGAAANRFNWASAGCRLWDCPSHLAGCVLTLPVLLFLGVFVFLMLFFLAIPLVFQRLLFPFSKVLGFSSPFARFFKGLQGEKSSLMFWRSVSPDLAN